MITKGEFEKGYAARSEMTVAELLNLGLRATSCECGEPDCQGWKMASTGIAAVTKEAAVTP